MHDSGLFYNMRYTCRRLSKSTLSVCVSLALMVCMYVTLYSGIKHSVTLKVHVNSTEIFIDHLDVVQGNIDDTGHFYDRLVRLLGVGALIDMFRRKSPKILRDESIIELDRTVDYANCAAIFNGDEDEINNTIAINEKTTTMDNFGKADYMAMTADCANFTRIRNYIMEPLSEVERDFPIAYSILMYTDVEQFETLLRAIYRPQNYYCIHVDLKSKNALLLEVQAIAGCFPNVYLTETMIDIKWGEMSVLEPELLCMRLLHQKGTLWKYFINLTGQEFPLKTNYELVQILKAYNGANDVESTRKKANKDRWKNKGQPPHGIVPAKGAVHAILCRGFVEYILNDQRAKDLLKWVATTEIPDETFFATLNSNPHLKVPGSYAGDPDRKSDRKPYLARFKNWRRSPCRGKYLRGICVFGVGDLPVLVERKELFANKFLWDYQRTTLQCLDELLYNRTRDEYFGNRKFDASWYGSLKFVVNQVKADSINIVVNLKTAMFW